MKDRKKLMEEIWEISNGREDTYDIEGILNEVESIVNNFLDEYEEKLKEAKNKFDCKYSFSDLDDALEIIDELYANI